ncbi:MAG: tetratricopeptide repeat protein [Polyangiaceae bacterium]
MRRSLTAFTALSLLTLASSSAFAQTKAPAAAAPAAAPAGAAPAAANPSTSTDPVDRARVHYERGLQLFNEENYAAALFEFDRAYELAPSYKILYNMGRIQRQQNNYAAALRSYARYLREGGTAVPPERRAEVETEIGVLKPRVAAVTVVVNISGADVYADDTPVCTATIESSCFGKSPLQSPIIVNGGRHKITATKAGYAPATSLISVVGSDTIDVKLDLVSYAQPVAAPRRIPWVGWGTTGALAVGAGVFGYIALSSSSKLETARAQPNADPNNLDSRASKVRTFGVVSDVLTVSAVVVGVVSLYYTLKWGKDSNEKLPKAGTALVPKLTPSFNGAALTF